MRFTAGITTSATLLSSTVELITRQPGQGIRTEPTTRCSSSISTSARLHESTVTQPSIMPVLFPGLVHSPCAKRRTLSITLKTAQRQSMMARAAGNDGAGQREGHVSGFGNAPAPLCTRACSRMTGFQTEYRPLRNTDAAGAPARTPSAPAAAGKCRFVAAAKVGTWVHHRRSTVSSTHERTRHLRSLGTRNTVTIRATPSAVRTHHPIISSLHEIAPRRDLRRPSRWSVRLVPSFATTGQQGSSHRAASQCRLQHPPDDRQPTQL